METKGVVKVVLTIIALWLVAGTIGMTLSSYVDSEPDASYGNEYRLRTFQLFPGRGMFGRQANILPLELGATMELQINGEWLSAFCIEFGILPALARTPDGIGNFFEDRANSLQLSPEQEEAIRLILMYGFGNFPGETFAGVADMNAYRVTQAAIWEITTPPDVTFGTDVLILQNDEEAWDINTSWLDVKGGIFYYELVAGDEARVDMYNSIRRNVARHGEIPSFMSVSTETEEIHELTWNTERNRYEIVLTDENQILPLFVRSTDVYYYQGYFFQRGDADNQPAGMNQYQLVVWRPIATYPCYAEDEIPQVAFRNAGTGNGERTRFVSGERQDARWRHGWQWETDNSNDEWYQTVGGGDEGQPLYALLRVQVSCESADDLPYHSEAGSEAPLTTISGEELPLNEEVEALPIEETLPPNDEGENHSRSEVEVPSFIDGEDLLLGGGVISSPRNSSDDSTDNLPEVSEDTQSVAGESLPPADSEDLLPIDSANPLLGVEEELQPDSSEDSPPDDEEDSSLGDDEDSPPDDDEDEDSPSDDDEDSPQDDDEDPLLGDDEEDSSLDDEEPPLDGGGEDSPAGDDESSPIGGGNRPPIGGGEGPTLGSSSERPTPPGNREEESTAQRLPPGSSEEGSTLRELPPPPCPPCPPCPSGVECPPCPPCPGEDPSENPGNSGAPLRGENSPTPPTPPTPSRAESLPSNSGSPSLLPDAGVVVGLAGLSALGGTALISSGVALASKKRKINMEKSLDESLNEEYGEMFEKFD